jgi:O-methyltransferase involved in polyketide biosynthesis
MAEPLSPSLSSVSESLLVTLYLRAIESQRPDALINDERAVALVKQISVDGRYDFNRIKLLNLSEANKVVIILRNRKFDYYTRDFLERHPNAVVVHIGCGLDTRFERVDNGLVEWFDLDFPHIIELRRKLIRDEGERYHLLGCSVLEDAWMEVVSLQYQRPFLFVAEGVLMYLTEAQNKSLVRLLLTRFPCAELIFDAYSPIHKIVSNLQTAKFGFRTQWGIWHGQELERWVNTSRASAGIRLLDEWGYFDDPEPRLAKILWLRLFEKLFRTLRIYHFQLGKAAG